MNKVIVSILLLASLPVFSQGYLPITKEEFGKNRIQLRRLDWRTVNSNNFEFNYYRSGQDIARKAAVIAEGEYRRITQILGYTPFTTMKIFLYNTPGQLSQSNIGLTMPIEYDGGILNLSRSRIEIPYAGSDSLFKIELIKQISGLFVYDMLFGGSLKEVLQSSLMLTLPEWYMSGIAAYIANDGMSASDVEKLKEAIARNEIKKINNLSKEDAEIIGQSIWHYIAVRYGRDNISNILNLTRIIRAERSSITSTLGISFVGFIKDWKSYYLDGGQLNNQNAILSSEEEETIVLDENGTPKLSNLDPDEIDTEYYEFDEINVLKAAELDQVSQAQGSSTFNRNRLNRNLEEFKLTPARTFENMLISQGLKTNFYNDPVRRMGMNNSIVLNDLLENHVMKLELFVAPRIKNHDLNASYMNYEKRIDWGFSFERKSVHFDQVHEKQYYLFRPIKINLPDGPINRRLFYHRIAANFSYPFSQNLRMNFSPSLFFSNDIDYYDIKKDKINSTYTGLKIDLVYDNTTKAIDTGFLNGTKAKFGYQMNLSLSGGEQNFNRLYFDFRHYKRLAKGLQIAARFNYGSSTGQNPKYTFLGGMENTLNRHIQPYSGQPPGESNDLRDILFYNYPGNLRGFDFAKLYGTNNILFNLELRFSLAGYFPRNTVTTSVIRNLQFILFNDIGTAWNGNKGPWSRQNSLNTQVVGGGNNPYYAVVTNFKNPFLVGYGAGIRTTLLGFLIKGDYGFGLENKEVGKGKFYFSLGHDF